MDTERISPTIAGAEARTALDLVNELNALSMDEDFALGELFQKQGQRGFACTGAACDNDHLLRQTGQDRFPLFRGKGKFCLFFGPGQSLGTVNLAQHGLRFDELR